MAQSELKVGLKVAFIVVNIIFLIIGCLLVGVGSHLFVSSDLEHYHVIGATDFIAPVRILFICCGVFILLTTLIGCIGAIREKSCLIILYEVFLCLLTLASIIAAALALSYSGRVQELARDGAALNIRQFYGIGANGSQPHPVTVSVDYVQKHEFCCGWLGAGESNIFLETPWYRKQSGAYVTSNPDEDATPLHQIFPESCCVSAVEKLDQCTRATDESYARTMGYMHTEDCVEQFVEKNGIALRVTLGVTIAAIVLQIVLLVLGGLALRQLSGNSGSRVV